MGSIADQTGIESPCVQLCDIDRETGLCCGCGRSLAEIASWSTLSIVERRGVIADLPARKAELPEGDPR